MGKLIIQLKTDIQSKSIDIEMLDEVKLSDLIPTLVKVINYPEIDRNGDAFHYWLSDVKGNSLSLESTPAEVGIRNRSILLLNRGRYLPENLSSNEKIEKVSKNQDDDDSDILETSHTIQRNISPQDIRGQLDVPASWKKIDVRDD